MLRWSSALALGALLLRAGPSAAEASKGGEPRDTRTVSSEEPRGAQPVSSQEPAPAQPVPNEEPAPAQPVPSEEPAPAQPVPSEEPAPAQPVSSEQPRGAQPAPGAAHRHFETALDHYRSGRYRRAISSLRAALELDPGSKDLLYNLALVHEKLGELDHAMAWLSRYIQEEDDPAEVQRAEQAVARMRGARADLRQSTEPSRAASGRTPGLRVEAAPRRLDNLVIVGIGVTAAAAVAGVIFGVRTLVLQAAASEPAQEPEQAVRRLKSARDSAMMADIAFSAGLLAGASTAILWVARTPEHPSVARGFGVSIAGSF